MPVKVSVIVPVYNAGDHLDDLVASLLAQSLPDDEYEVIFADDASTDGTAQRLDEVAEENPKVRVLHNWPNSGWPGRPRNLGIDAACGEYLYFVDADDWLEPQALERMYDYGTEHDSDIVWGRVVGEGRYVPRAIFRRNIPDAVLGKHPLLSLLTVHKMFRTSLVRSAGLRFPEGRKRLEDHHFVVPAYFAANRISVLADYPCYHWRRIDGAGNISSQIGDVQEYFTSVREVVDIVEANTEPGDLRDKLVMHWYGGKSLRWFENDNMTTFSPEYRRELFDAVRTLALERFPPHIDRLLPLRRRMSSELVRRGDLDCLVALMGWLAGVRVTAVADPVGWDGDELQVRLATRLEDASARALTIERRGERTLFRLPAELGIQLSPESLDVGGAVRRTAIDGYLRNRTTDVLSLQHTDKVSGPEFDEHGVAELRAVAQVTIDPRKAVLTAPSGVHDVLARMHCSGWSLDARPALLDPRVVDGLPRTIDRVVVTAYGTEGEGNLSVRRTRVPPPPKAPRPPAPRPTTRARVVRRLRRIVRQLRSDRRTGPSGPAQ